MPPANRQLYVTYTDDLANEALRAIKTARDAGWTVLDGLSGLANRLDAPRTCDALLLFSAFTYGDDEAGKAIQEREWDAFVQAGKPARALLLDESVSLVPLTAMEAWTHPERIPALKAFRQKLKASQRSRLFESSALESAVLDQLELLKKDVTHEISVFVVWDFELLDVDLILTSLRERPPEGFRFDVPRTGGAAGGDILLKTVVPGIRDNERVLIVSDRPNANVGFEAGLALGFGKRTCLIHFGSSVPAWLKNSLFTGFNVDAIDSLDQLRTYIKDETKWYTPGPIRPIPQSGPTLFLCSRHAGSALRELASDACAHWERVPDQSSFNEAGEMLSRVSQIVWAITPFAEGADVRDGADNAANGVVAGWFVARTFQTAENGNWDRLTILRHDRTRSVTDVSAKEVTFANVEGFISRVRQVPDRRLPQALSLESRTFGNAQYELVKTPLQTSHGKALWAGRYPVTNRQYRRFLMATGGSIVENSVPGMDDLPVVNVSLNEAERFCRWALLELPTAEEWKQLMLAGSASRYWWSDDSSVVRVVAWYAENSHGRLQSVGAKSPNTWGLHDLLGNVWEWTKRYQRIIEAPFNDVSGEIPQADAFGGAFDSSLSGLLIARIGISPDYRDPYTGFRCVLYE